MEAIQGFESVIALFILELLLSVKGISRQKTFFWFSDIFNHLCLSFKLMKLKQAKIIAKSLIVNLCNLNSFK